MRWFFRLTPSSGLFYALALIAGITTLIGSRT